MTTVIFRSLTMVAALAGAALAADVNSIVQHAKAIEADANQVNLTLKSKKFDAADLKTKIDGAHANFSKLQTAVQEYETANPAAVNTAEWKAVKNAWNYWAFSLIARPNW